jgi:YHS domain-containing protein
MGWLLRLLLFLLLIVVVMQALVRIAGGFMDGLSGRSSRGRSRVPTKGTAMVRDPVCGTFVVQSRALTAVRGRHTAWFCSEDCRRQWQAAQS